MNKKLSVLITGLAVVIVLVVGMVLVPIAGANPDPTVPPGYFAEIYASVTDPMTLSFDGDGNLFVGRDNSGSGGGSADSVPIHRVSGGGSVVEEFGSAIFDPDGVIADINGIVTTLGPGSVIAGGLVCDPGCTSSRLTEISPDGALTQVLFDTSDTTLDNPDSLAFDNSGRLLFPNYSNGTVGMVDGGVLSTFVTLGGGPAGIAIDSDDQVYVSDWNGGTVALISSGGTVVNGAFATGLSFPYGMDLDSTGLFGGELYVAEGSNISRIDLVTGATEVFASGLAAPQDVKFGPDGCMYVSEFGADTIWKICADQVEPSCTPPPADLVSWWPGDGNATDIMDGNDGTLQNGATFGTGMVDQAFSFDGFDDFVEIANTATMDVGTGDFTIDLWINFDSLATEQTIIHKVVGLVPDDQTYFVEFNVGGFLRFMVREGANQNDLIIPVSLVTGQWYYVAAVRAGIPVASTLMVN